MNEIEKSGKELMLDKAKLYKKMHAVMSEAGYVQKKGYNAFHKYAYAQEADILEHIKPLLVAKGIFFSFQATELTKIGELTSVKLVATFGDIDTGYSLEIPFCGEGQDKGDKGIYKAYTGGLKYLLMKNFLLPTGDDPELEGEEEREHKKESNRLARTEAVVSQAKLNKETGRLPVASPPAEPTPEEIREEVKEVFGNAPSWTSTRPKPSIPLCPVLPMKPTEALQKEVDDQLEIQGISTAAFTSACVGVFKRIMGDWNAEEWGKAVQYLKDMAEGKVTLETTGGRGSFKQFEESPEPEAWVPPAPKFKIEICQKIWTACMEKARVQNKTPEEILKDTSRFPTEEGKEKYLTLDDLVRATKETKWFKNTLRKLDIPEKEIPF